MRCQPAKPERERAAGQQLDDDGGSGSSQNSSTNGERLSRAHSRLVDTSVISQRQSSTRERCETLSWRASQRFTPAAASAQGRSPRNRDRCR